MRSRVQNAFGSFTADLTGEANIMVHEDPGLEAATVLPMETMFELVRVACYSLMLPRVWGPPTAGNKVEDRYAICPVNGGVFIS